MSFLLYSLVSSAESLYFLFLLLPLPSLQRLELARIHALPLPLPLVVPAIQLLIQPRADPHYFPAECERVRLLLVVRHDDVVCLRAYLRGRSLAKRFFVACLARAKPVGPEGGVERGYLGATSEQPGDASRLVGGPSGAGGGEREGELVDAPDVPSV